MAEPRFTNTMTESQHLKKRPRDVAMLNDGDPEVLRPTPTVVSTPPPYGSLMLECHLLNLNKHWGLMFYEQCGCGGNHPPGKHVCFFCKKVGFEHKGGDCPTWQEKVVICHETHDLC